MVILKLVTYLNDTLRHLAVEIRMIHIPVQLTTRRQNMQPSQQIGVVRSSARKVASELTEIRLDIVEDLAARRQIAIIGIDTIEQIRVRGDSCLEIGNDFSECLILLGLFIASENHGNGW